MIYVNDHIARLDIATALASVSDQRREHALRYRKEHDRRLSLAAYLLLCDALKKEYGFDETPTFGFGTHGKPFLAEHPDIHFNLSHCDHAAVCAVASHPVGIDVECIALQDDEVVKRTMNEQERQLIAQSPRPEATFTRLWTMKESVLKLSGDGIADNLHAVLNDSDAKYRFETFERDKYICTLCEYK